MEAEQFQKLMAVLEQIRDSVAGQDDLDFCDRPQGQIGRFIYVNKSGMTGTPWYWRSDGKNIPIEAQALKCRIIAFAIVQAQNATGEARGFKCHLTVLTRDGEKILEFGSPFPDDREPEKYPGNIFAKGLIAAILSMSDQQLAGKVWIEPNDEGASKQTILFCRLYDATRNPLMTEWRKDQAIDWYRWTDQAIAKINRVCGGAQPDTADEPETPQATPTGSTPENPIEPEADLGGTGVIDQIKVRLRRAHTVDELVAIAVWINEDPQHESLNAVPQAYGWVLDALRGRFAAISQDSSGIVALTSVEMQRIGWQAQDGRNYLSATYRKRSRQELHEGELLDFLGFLKLQPASLLGVQP